MDFFFKINFKFSHVSCSFCNLSHMDSRLYNCFCVILIDCIGFLLRLPTFGKTGCHVRARDYGLLEYHECKTFQKAKQRNSLIPKKF